MSRIVWNMVKLTTFSLCLISTRKLNCLFHPSFTQVNVILPVISGFLVFFPSILNIFLQLQIVRESRHLIYSMLHTWVSTGWGTAWWRDITYSPHREHNCNSSTEYLYITVYSHVQWFKTLAECTEVVGVFPVLCSSLRAALVSVIILHSVMNRSSQVPSQQETCCLHKVTGYRRVKSCSMQKQSRGHTKQESSHPVIVLLNDCVTDIIFHRALCWLLESDLHHP